MLFLRKGEMWVSILSFLEIFATGNRKPRDEEAIEFQSFLLWKFLQQQYHLVRIIAFLSFNPFFYGNFCNQNTSHSQQSQAKFQSFLLWKFLQQEAKKQRHRSHAFGVSILSFMEIFATKERQALSWRRFQFQSFLLWKFLQREIRGVCKNGGVISFNPFFYGNFCNRNIEELAGNDELKQFQSFLLWKFLQQSEGVWCVCFSFQFQSFLFWKFLQHYVGRKLSEKMGRVSILSFMEIFATLYAQYATLQ